MSVFWFALKKNVTRIKQTFNPGLNIGTHFKVKYESQQSFFSLSSLVTMGDISLGPLNKNIILDKLLTRRNDKLLASIFRICLINLSSGFLIVLFMHKLIVCLGKD